MLPSLGATYGTEARKPVPRAGDRRPGGAAARSADPRSAQVAWRRRADDQAMARVRAAAERPPRDLRIRAAAGHQHMGSGSLPSSRWGRVPSSATGARRHSGDWRLRAARSTSPRRVGDKFGPGVRGSRCTDANSSRRKCTVRDGIAVTTVARTLFDLAERSPPHELKGAWDEASRLRLLRVPEVVAIYELRPGRRRARAEYPALPPRRAAPRRNPPPPRWRTVSPISSSPIACRRRRRTSWSAATRSTRSGRTHASSSSSTAGNSTRIAPPSRRTAIVTPTTCSPATGRSASPIAA